VAERRKLRANGVEREKNKFHLAERLKSLSIMQAAAPSEKASDTARKFIHSARQPKEMDGWTVGRTGCNSLSRNRCVAVVCAEMCMFYSETRGTNGRLETGVKFIYSTLIELESGAARTHLLIKFDYSSD